MDAQLGSHAMPVSLHLNGVHIESLAELGCNHEENKQNDMVYFL